MGFLRLSRLVVQMGGAYGASHGGTPNMQPLPYSGAKMGPSPSLPAGYGHMSQYMGGGSSDGAPQGFPPALQVPLSMMRTWLLM